MLRDPGVVPFGLRQNRCFLEQTYFIRRPKECYFCMFMIYLLNKLDDKK